MTAYLADVAALARKDLRLELRARDTLPAMVLFVVATLVVFHTAVLSYVADAAERQAFAAEARRIAPAWIANEAPSVLP